MQIKLITRSAIHRDLRTQKYRSRVVEDKKRKSNKRLCRLKIKH